MPKNPVIRVSSVQAIVVLVRGWPENEALTWDALCERSAPVVGYRPTRQALSAKEDISTAFQAKKKGLRSRPDGKSSRPSSLTAAEQTISRLRSENDELRLGNERLKQKFVVWLYNASVAGVYPDQLDRPLPAIDREASKQALPPSGRKPTRPALKVSK